MPRGRNGRRHSHLGEWIAAGIVSAVVLALAAIGRTWPFRSIPVGIEGTGKPSVWQYVLSDRTTLGFVRLTLVFAGLFVIASVIALAVRGRWIRGLGGLSVDEKEAGKERIEELEAQLRKAQTDLEHEQKLRFEAEDWADALIDELDETKLELDAAREEVTSERQDDDAGNPRGDQTTAG
jgi:hypothetical protein